MSRYGSTVAMMYTDQGSPPSPGHRSEVTINLRKQVNVIQVHKSPLEPLYEGEIDSTWRNLADEVFKAEVGIDKFRQAMDTQSKLFKVHVNGALHRKSCQDGSLMSDFAIYLKEEKMKTLTGPRALRMRQRLRRHQGIGMNGFAVFEDCSALPKNDFFVRGRLTELVGVHSNYPYAEDDATVCTRTLGLKFSHHPVFSPFDLMLHTGCISPVFTADSIEDFVAGLENEEARKKYLLTLPIYLRAHIESARAAPSSYYHQQYYCHVTYAASGSDGVTKPVRFRVIPADGTKEIQSGRLTAEQQFRAWETSRAADDQRSPDYLKTEMETRLKSGVVEYLLQAQSQNPVEPGHQCHMTYNQTIPWTTVTSPWSTVARLTFTTPVPEDVTEIVRFHVGRKPDCLSFREAESYVDFNFVPHILKNACDVVDQVMPRQQDASRINGEMTDYIVYVVGGEQSNSGTDGHATMCIIGSESCTSYRKLRQDWRDEIERGNNRNTYVVRDKIVGDLLCVKLALLPKDKGAQSDWFLEYLVISTPYNGRCYTFPCYGWIKYDETVPLREGKGLLSSVEQHPYLRLQRRLELQQRKEKYQWAKPSSEDRFHGLPGHLAAGDDTTQIPHELLFDDFQEIENEWIALIKGNWEGVGKIKQKIVDALSFRKDSAVEPYARLVSELSEDDPELKERMRVWSSDEEFGRELLNGCNPGALWRLTELPDDLAVSSEELDAYFTDGNFQYELQVGRIYMVSFPELPTPNHQSKTRKRFLTSPKVLLHSREDTGAVMPLVIQLSPIEGALSAVFTPSDDQGRWSAWQVAKLSVRCAYVQSVLLNAYLFNAVFALEPIAIALLRNLSSVHPVSKLLLPHLRYIPAVATLWRKVLLGQDGAFVQMLSIGENPGELMDVLRRLTSSFRINKAYLPANLAERGVLDPNSLPNFFYRDDGMKICGAIRDFCSDVTTIYYRDNEDVELDDELNSFLADLKANGLPNDLGLQDAFTTREEVSRFMALVIFRCTSYASAVTGRMLSQMAFCPSAPPALMEALPGGRMDFGEKGLSDDKFKAMLPPPEMAAKFVSFLKRLCRHKGTSQLGEYTEKWFTEGSAHSAIRRFQTRLEEIDELIRNRDETLTRKYSVLRSDLTPNYLTA